VSGLRDKLSLAALVLANLVPLAGVLWLGWDTRFVVLLYWAENLVVGAYTVLKLALVQMERPAQHLQKLFNIPFFCIHFGGFTAVHGVLLMSFFGLGDGMEGLMPEHTWLGPLVFVQMLVAVVTKLWGLRPPGMEWPLLALVVSHGVSFMQNFLFGREYATLTLNKVMSQPYGRIVVLHAAIIAGGIFVLKLGSPLPLLIILVGFKIGLDLWLHRRSHRTEPGRAGARPRRMPGIDRSA
jgi:hypothetical protein